MRGTVRTDRPSAVLPADERAWDALHPIAPLRPLGPASAERPARLTPRPSVGAEGRDGYGTATPYRSRP